MWESVKPPQPTQENGHRHDAGSCDNGHIDDFHMVFRAQNGSGILSPLRSIRKIEFKQVQM